MYLTYSIPVLGALALLMALFSRSAPGWVRGFAVLSAIVTLGIAAFLWPYGWIGVQTWL